MGGDIEDATVRTERPIVVHVTVVVSHSRQDGPLCRARATHLALWGACTPYERSRRNDW
jgi:hypothetical protein